MAKIPGYAYIIIGAVVAGFSIYINSLRDNKGMSIFIYVGIGLAIIGVGKIIFQIMHREPKQKENKEHTGNQNVHHKTSHHVQQHNPRRIQHHQNRNLEAQHQTNNKFQNHPQQASHHSQIPTTHHQNSAYKTHQEHITQHTPQHSVFPKEKICPGCHGKNSGHANFCMRCGHRL